MATINGSPATVVSNGDGSFQISYTAVVGSPDPSVLAVYVGAELVTGGCSIVLPGQGCQVQLLDPSQVSDEFDPARTKVIHRCKSGEKLNVVRGCFGWESAHGARFATPADFALHDGTPYRGLHVRRWGLGFVRRSRVRFLSPRAQNANVTICNFLRRCR
jgi:hypothetical protein